MTTISSFLYNPPHLLEGASNQVNNLESLILDKGPEIDHQLKAENPYLLPQLTANDGKGSLANYLPDGSNILPSSFGNIDLNSLGEALNIF